MSLAVEKLDGSMAKLTITVPAEEFTKAITSAYNKQKSKFSVPGFRKGKVPQAFIEKMYGAAIFYEDAANQLINEYYTKDVYKRQISDKADDSATEDYPTFEAKAIAHSVKLVQAIVAGYANA